MLLATSKPLILKLLFNNTTLKDVKRFFHSTLFKKRQTHVTFIKTIVHHSCTIKFVVISILYFDAQIYHMHLRNIKLSDQIFTTTNTWPIQNSCTKCKSNQTIFKWCWRYLSLLIPLFARVSIYYISLIEEIFSWN